ncbi:MAG: FkbM family methyltransferase [Candidatus Wallbacteria bacterium]|nr:FkbM family methyltransferase [Candidatus Wallbacteria bacterium]
MNRILKMMFQNPRLLIRRITTRTGMCFRTPPVSGRHLGRVNGIAFEFDFGLRDGMIAEMYHGRYEIDILVELKRFLTRGQTFVDIGANIGYISAYAAGLVGSHGSVHAFEPVPKYFNRLQRLKELNPSPAFQLNNFALGDTTGRQTIYVAKGNIGANSFVPGKDELESEEVVMIDTFDNYVADHPLHDVGMIKIDCEGYEYKVLLGMQNFLSSLTRKPVILIELSPQIYKMLGHSAYDLIRLMRAQGYRVFDLKTNRILKKELIERALEINDVLNCSFRPMRRDL